MLQFAPIWWLMRLFMLWIQFTINEIKMGCLVTAQIYIQTGPPGAWLNRHEFDAVRKHISKVREWAGSVWEAWSPHHLAIKKLAGQIVHQ